MSLTVQFSKVKLQVCELVSALLVDPASISILGKESQVVNTLGVAFVIVAFNVITTLFGEGSPKFPSFTPSIGTNSIVCWVYVPAFFSVCLNLNVSPSDKLPNTFMSLPYAPLFTLTSQPVTDSSTV